MSRVTRPWLACTLAAAGVLAGATPAPAQFYGGAMYGGFNPVGWTPIPRGWFTLPPVMNVSPLPGVGGFNPLMFSPFNRVYNPANQAAVSYYYYNRLGSYQYGAYNQSPYTSLYASPGAGTYGAPTGGYIAGGVRNAAVDRAALDYGRAQQQSTASWARTTGAREAIADQRAYEQRGDRPAAPRAEAADPVTKALTTTDAADLASGEALTVFLAAAAAAEAKGAKADSAFLPPNLLAEVRFAGGSGADALNLLRPGKLELPAAFAAGPLAPVGADLEKDFAAAAAPALAGKAPEAAKVARLEATAKRARDQLNPALKDMDFEDATAARRFLARVDAAAAALKAPGAGGLVDPKWSTEGTTVAELVRYMTRNKLRFAPAERGHEEAYAVLHRGLAAYLFALGQSNQPKK